LASRLKNPKKLRISFIMDFFAWDVFRSTSPLHVASIQLCEMYIGSPRFMQIWASGSLPSVDRLSLQH
jgi:hypothetical protein